MLDLTRPVAMTTLHHGSSEDKANLYEKVHFLGAVAETVMAQWKWPNRDDAATFFVIKQVTFTCIH